MLTTCSYLQTYDGISMWTPEGHWRFQVGDDDAPGGFCDLLREKATDPELAIKEWKALKGRLEPLYDALDACPLTALRQDAGKFILIIIWAIRLMLMSCFVHRSFALHGHRDSVLPHAPERHAGHTVHPRQLS